MSLDLFLWGVVFISGMLAAYYFGQYKAYSSVVDDMKKVLEMEQAANRNLKEAKKVYQTALSDADKLMTASVKGKTDGGE